MRLLIFGTTGQVAIELARNAPLVNATVVALGRDQADLTDPDACAAAIDATDADIIINAAAYTAVDAAETDAATAHLVNADAPGAMARAAARRGLAFLHISTDYVFDGTSDRPWVEGDTVAPLGVYGASKLDGERQITAAQGPHVILRTAWVFSAHGKNFVRTMLRLGADRDSLSVVDDQRGGPTPAHEIAKALLAIACAFHEGRGVTGIFHFAGQPTCTWADFAEAIFATSSNPHKPRITRIPTSAYPTPARRPANSALNCTHLRNSYGIGQPDWRSGLKTVIHELETKA